jgi:RNA polymerase sigma factor (sigma-70 family)
MAELPIHSVRAAEEADIDGSLVALIPALQAFSRNLCVNGVDSDDLVQETLAKAIANIDRYQRGTNLKSWLFTIMRNSFYNNLRVFNRERPGLGACAADLPATPAGQEWRLRAAEMQRLIDRLPPDQREALVLVALGGLRYEEAAAVAGCPVGTVKSRLNRARQALLGLLQVETAAALFADAGPGRA